MKVYVTFHTLKNTINPHTFLVKKEAYKVMIELLSKNPLRMYELMPKYNIYLDFRSSDYYTAMKKNINISDLIIPIS